MAPEAEALITSAHEALATSILCAFAATVLAGKRAGDPSGDILQRMERFIAEEYSRPVTLKDIARGACASRQHLLKLCRMTGKSTPTKLLYTVRLEAAAHLLLHTGFSIAQIAEQCGFANQFHFSRKFKQEYGSSPFSWRVQAWKQQRYKK